MASVENARTAEIRFAQLAAPAILIGVELPRDPKSRAKLRRHHAQIRGTLTICYPRAKKIPVVR